jgi:hypothetical protein
MACWQAWKKSFCTALFVGLASTQALAADPILSITATPSPAVSGSQVTLNVRISGVVDLFAWQFSLAFNPAVLQAVGGTEGSFLTGAGTTSYSPGVIDNTTGKVSFAYSALFGAGPGASGTGVVANMTFNAIAAGSSALNFSDVLFLNTNLNTITLQVTNGNLLVSAVPEPTTALLFAAGLLGVGALRLRKTQAA